MNDVFTFAVFAAAAVFPQWEKISVHEILKPVPAFEYARTGYTVTKKDSPQKPLPDDCRIIEGGKVVGYRLSCN